MCGRYQFELNQNPEIKRIYDLAATQGEKPAIGEVTPGSNPATIIIKDQKICVVAMKWGFPGFKPTQLVINARRESVESKVLFKNPFLKSRCVFPATGFYEWDQLHQKYLFDYGNEQNLYLAGFYAYFNNVACSVILTTEPNVSVKAVHERMPVILTKSQIKPWLTDLNFARRLITAQMPSLRVEKKS
ncbi:SOS response-associated peptidase family protein [Xylocopilactobacillus apicola]|uniref:Abasic site processing protein n=1 Tax=Xylocopilactobacillus apicola TaxID=2932184 RepID=A0AAU9DT77_9LACO|nr:SOS response-associated peptidase family protein [Xylocopilactobacillus apicola]BDR59314.1 DUF159 family protein [Xylocopilactobacillus apicola]